MENKNIWNRKCKTEGCNSLARIGSDYCIQCRKDKKTKECESRENCDGCEIKDCGARI